MYAVAIRRTHAPGFGQWAEILSATLQTGLAVTSTYFKWRSDKDARTHAKHEVERQQAAAAELSSLEAERIRALQQASQVQAAASASTPAGGGPVVLSASGRVLPTGGVSALLGGGGGVPWLLIGAGTLALVVVLTR